MIRSLSARPAIEPIPMEPFRLLPWFSPRIWGRRDLSPWYTSTGFPDPVGEAWLTGPECVVETGRLAGRTLAQVASEFGTALLGSLGHDQGEFPLLLKLLFPNEKLSVQVHPDDEAAEEMGAARGKTECWYVLEAEPGASVALGLKGGADEEQIRAAVQTHSLEDLLHWLPVTPGQMIFVDAGTVHAIGPGVVLLETQQTSDITFRMYDYGRPRELHLEQALQVMKHRTEAGPVVPRGMDGYVRLIEQEYFIVDRFEVGAGKVAFSMDGPGCLVGLAGSGVVRCTSGEVDLCMGQAVVIPAQCGEVVVSGLGGLIFVRCVAPPPQG